MTTAKFDLIEMIATALATIVKDADNERAHGILETFQLMADINDPADAKALKAVNDIWHEIVTGKITDVNDAFRSAKKALKKAWNEPEPEWADIVEGR